MENTSRTGSEPANYANRLIYCCIFIGLLEFLVVYYLRKGDFNVSYFIGELFADYFITFLIGWFLSRKKPWSVIKSLLMLSLISCFFHAIIFVGRPQNNHDDHKNAEKVSILMNSMMSLFEQYAKTIESVKDEVTAKTALVHLDELYTAAQSLVDRAKHLPPTSTREMNEIKKTYEPRMEKLGVRLKKACEVLVQKIEESAPFEKQFDKMFTLFQELANSGNGK